MAPNIHHIPLVPTTIEDARIRVAILGTGMMGQEHISYILGYSDEVRIDFLCDPFENSLTEARRLIMDSPYHEPKFLSNEEELLASAGQIDLLVIASPNYMHTPTLLRWGVHDITILCEKPVSVSQDQHDELIAASKLPEWNARLWTAMEYRYIPAIAKLLSLLPEIGELKMVTIRENRYPFLHKIGEWNRDRAKTGDTLVEKCCHFFDLFRLITGKEVDLSKVRALAQRGINYGHEENQFDVPIIDSAYVTMPFHGEDGRCNTVGCLELCMFAEGSRHQEEIIVTGSKGRLEAYLPENKVFMYQRPNMEKWQDRSIPPPKSSVHEQVFDCSNVKDIHGIADDIPTHGGYHYCSTAVEWYYLLAAVRKYRDGSNFQPHVSLSDGLKAVEIGIQATSTLADGMVSDCRDM
mmetsp:Transcript_25153/g.62023  ORF Transcript_25153/g.62023 Transcript_25153/m.62023 type:complete len:409 (+) Transcript_25153:114-1340(+)